MSKLTNNRTFNIIVGAATLYFAFSLWRDGWFDWFLNGRDDSEGYSNSQLWITLGSLVLSFLEMVGIATIAIVTGILPHAETTVTWAAKQLKALIQSARDSISKKDDSSPNGEQWDWRLFFSQSILHRPRMANLPFPHPSLSRNLCDPKGSSVGCIHPCKNARQRSLGLARQCKRHPMAKTR
jgi:hypothetical protein